MSDPFVSPTATEPVTPIRPARSTHRLSSHSVMTTRSLPLNDTPPVPALVTSDPFSSPFASPFSDANTSSPRTPFTPVAPPSAFIDGRQISRKPSSTSIRRKPVPLHVDDVDLPTPSVTFAHNGSPSPYSRAQSLEMTTYSGTTSGGPPVYVLPVDPPSYDLDSSRHGPLDDRSDSLPARLPQHDAAMLGIDTGVRENVPSAEDLPRYTAEKEIEPHTLARSLWRWGWLCPLLWAIGMCILWIPLRPTDEEEDPEKAQKMEEMIVMLREAELQYAKRCMRAFVAFACVLIVVIVLGVVLSMAA